MVNGSENNLYFGLNISPDNQLQKMNEVDSFGTNYFTLALHGGYERPLTHFLGDGSLLAEVGYSYLTGDGGNLESKRHHGELKLGWKQSWTVPSTRVNLFLSPKVGVGAGGDKLNFGSGLFPDWSFGASAQVQGTAGAEYCFPNVCVSAGAGYFYERNVIGADYDNRGLLVGVSATIGLDPEVRVETKTVTEVREVEKIVYRDKIIQDDKPEELTLEKIAGALVSDGQSFGIPYFFKNESAELGLRAGEEPNLTILVLGLQSHPEITLLLEGHSDNSGPANYNNWLSYKRVKEVQEYLIKAGVPKERIIVDGQDLSILEVIENGEVRLYYTNPASLEVSRDLLPPQYKKCLVDHLDENLFDPSKRRWIHNAAGRSVLGSTKPLSKIPDAKVREALEKRVTFLKIK